MFRVDIARASDALLSIRSTLQEHSQALAALEQCLARLALEAVPSTDQTPLLDAFLKLQDGFQYNVTAVLLDWLGRTLAQQEATAQSQDDPETLRLNLVRCLGIMQGLLLLHRRSQRLFARRSSMEYILAIIDLARPSHVSSPLLGSAPVNPSPVLFPYSPAPSPLHAPNGRPPSPATSSPTALSLVALETLLCALVDRPLNMRVFERADGLAIIVRVLKDKSVSHVVRIKVIEILYYYLLPEHTSRRSASSTSTASSVVEEPYIADPSLPRILAHAADFVPQTPMKVRHVRPASSSSSRGPPSPSRNSTPGGVPCLSSDDETAQGDHDGTPRAGRRKYEQSDGTPIGRRRVPSSSGKSASSRSVSQVDSQSVTRSEEEKRQLLRMVMPNVDALEERFRVMGLRRTWSGGGSNA